jgi:hypothetical protein
MNKINPAVSDWLRQAFLRHETFGCELRSNVAQVEGPRQIKACLDYWSLEFGYYLLFVIWCLEFFKLTDPTLLRYPVRLN